MITPVKFLGATVTGFGANAGWGSQESRLQCSLVEDYRADDFFNPPEIGFPVMFDFMGWQFGGLLENWQQDNNFSTNPGYTVSIVDPRVLLDGVHIILSDFYGQTNGVPNLINVYGYLENTGGFGASRSNDSGIEWWRVVQVITQLTLSTQPSPYGGPISYKTVRYNLNLSALPLIPNYYRVSATPSMSIMDFINEICEVGGCEYFITLLGNTITINTVSRANIPLAGVINSFVNQTEGAASKNVGLDMVNDVCSKFLIGGKKSAIYLSRYGTGPDNDITSTADNPIAHYWGQDADGNLITSDGSNAAFVIDARGVLIPNVPNSYKTDVDEMRAALVSQDSWETFLWLHCFNQYVFDASNGDDSETDLLYEIRNNKFDIYFLYSKSYKHAGVINPHFRKAFDIGIGCRFNYNLAAQINGVDPTDIVNSNINLYRQYTLPGYNKEQEDNMTKLYGLVRQYAEEYYGRKFTINLPTVYAKSDPDTGEVSYSHNIVEAGYLDESEFQNGVINNLLPVYVDDVRTPDGRINAYVRFDDIVNLDLSGLEPQDLSFGVDLIKRAGGKSYTGKPSVFIRCTVEDNIVFGDRINYTSPKAVVTLTSRIFTKEPEYGSGVLAEYINKQAEMNDWTDDQKRAVISKFLTGVNADIFNTLTFPTAVFPALAAVPIESNLETYGPWYASGANGRIDVEQAEDLVPWNYDGFDNMDLAANARVSEVVANLQWMESGKIEFPGVPAAPLGSQLLQQGPYITDVNVQIGTDRITTTYTMRTWNPRVARMSKYVADRINKVNLITRQIKKNLREKIKLNTFKGRYLEVGKGLMLP